MTGSATDVSPKGSSDLNILERLELISLEQPEQNEYAITTEAEAQEILTAMAASLHSMSQSMANGPDKRVLLDYAATYRLSVVRMDSLGLLRSITFDPDQDDLVIWGLRLVVPAIVLN
jgi:hypothetical protein